MKTLIIGMGRMGERHLQNVFSCELNVTALFDVNANRLEQVAKQYDLNADVKLVTHMDQLQMLNDVELVIIATNADWHLTYTRICAGLGSVKKILCEKPMAPSVSDCREMIHLCNDAGIALSINHQMRFMEQYTRTKDLAASDQMGGLVSVTACAGNFGLAMNGTHYFEAFKFLGNTSISGVSAILDSDDVPNPRGEQYKDAGGIMTLKNDNNMNFHLNTSVYQGHGIIVTYFCRNGFIVVNELTGEVSYEYREAEHRDLPTTRYGCSSVKKQLSITPADAIKPSRDVLEALLAGNNYPTGEDGLEAMAVLIAAHQSASQQGCLIAVSAIDESYTLPIA